MFCIANIAIFSFYLRYISKKLIEMKNITKKTIQNNLMSNQIRLLLSQAILLFCLVLASSASAQTPEGTWKFTPSAGAFMVGPSQGNGAWFTSSAADVTTRACLFDDEYVFNADGSFENVLGSQTWLESWQAGSPAEGCGTPIAPHDGTNSATWSYSSFTNTMLQLLVILAFKGMAKVQQGQMKLVTLLTKQSHMNGINNYFD